VRAAIADAIEAETSFARNEAAELQNIRQRLEGNIAQLSERGRLASQAMEAVGVKSRQVADKVARTVGELQITDITCQRIEHVRTALGLLSERLGQEGGQNRLGAAICRLQQQQLQQASLDYVVEIEELIGNLGGLSGDATDLLGEADRAFADSQGGLFLIEIERDVARAIALVEHYDEARVHRNAMIEAVSRGFREMSDDLDAIRSIDADMRIMGLNATLKCGRLGRSGMALGVVAQELRACSRRTEDGARNVGELLGQALETARQLSIGQEQGKNLAGDLSPTQVMAESVASLSHMSAAMTTALDRLHGAAPEVAAKLAECAGKIVFHRRVEREVDRCFSLIGQVADGFGSDQDFTEAEYEAVRAMVDPLYTMDSERLIHRQFDGLAVAETAAASSVDDFFF
jgi:hypothetical protein